MFSSLVPGVVFFFLLATICRGAPTSNRQYASKALFQGPQVYLTVNPLASYKNENGTTVLLDRLLEMHWENFNYSPNDMIGIFSDDPASKTASYVRSTVIEEHPVTSGSGNIMTTARYERRELNSTMERCLGFWIAYFRTTGDNDTTILMSRCLTVQPTWMNDLKSEIGNTPLHSLMIPGTHNAASWRYYEGKPSEGAIVEYTYCHDDAVYEQLIHGIRSLDIRVGHYPLTQEKFFSNHDVIPIRPLRRLLEDVRRFVLETNEIVMLDFHRFPVGFGNIETHKKFVAFIEEEIGDLLAPKSLTMSATPEQLWQLNRTVVLFYIESSVQAEYDFLWPGVRQAWGDVNKVEDLEAFLRDATSGFGCRRTAWSAMAQLTALPEDFLLRPFFGVRGYANLANNNISQWYQRESWYSQANIIALDYYLGTNLIETSINVNKNKANTCS